MILDDSEATKFCPDCRQDLPVSAFTKNKRQADGLAFYCRDCSNARQLASRRARFGPRKVRLGPKDVPEGKKWCPELMLAAYAYLQGEGGRDLVHDYGFTVSLSLVPPPKDDLGETA
jgi:hypothetical protein